MPITFKPSDDIQRDFVLTRRPETHCIDLVAATEPIGEEDYNAIVYDGVSGNIVELTANIIDLHLIYHLTETGEWLVYWPEADINTIGTLELGKIYSILTYQTQCWEVPTPPSPPPPSEITLDRFLIGTHEVPGDRGFWRFYCFITNTGQGAGVHKSVIIGEEWNSHHYDWAYPTRVMLYPGQSQLITLSAESAKKEIWLQATIDSNPISPVVHFRPGTEYAGEGAVVICDDITEYSCTAYYSRKSPVPNWKIRAATIDGGPEHVVNYPDLSLPDDWETIYHAITGLLSGREYRVRIQGGPGWYSAEDTFSTKPS